MSIIDGMALVQKMKPSGATFQQLADNLLKSILSISKNAEIIDVVFYVYKDDSIKNAERIRRSSGQIAIRKIVPSSPVNQWSQFLSMGSNKAALDRFFVSQWSNHQHFTTVDRGTFLVTVDDVCMELSRHGERSMFHLKCSQEETDTRMFFHLLDGCRRRNKFVIHTDDTDVFLLALAVSERTGTSIFIKTGTKGKSRIIDLDAIKQSIKEKYLPNDVNMDDFTQALVSLHAFTGCDTVSAFAGKGKLKALKTMCEDEAFIQLYKLMGQDREFTETNMIDIQSFVCKLYGYTMSKLILSSYIFFDIRSIVPRKEALIVRGFHHATLPYINIPFEQLIKVIYGNTTQKLLLMSHLQS